MGYYTYFRMEVLEGEDENTDLIQEFRGENYNAQDAFDTDGSPMDNVKWYDWDKDAKAFSEKHPNVLFKISGEGEESGDIWDCYFKNGKFQMCQGSIVIPEYDETKFI